MRRFPHKDSRAKSLFRKVAGAVLACARDILATSAKQEL